MKELEEKIFDMFAGLNKLLICALKGASRRFSEEDLYFKETCFPRLHTLHFRLNAAEVNANRLIRWLQSQKEMEVEQIDSLHEELEADRKVEVLLASVRPIEEEAEYIHR